MTKEEIKDSVSLEEVLRSRYGIRPNKKGMCSCPFHGQDKTPSMKIYTRNNTFYCFACGAAGDVFTFVRKMENISFKEAFELLGGEHNAKDETEWRYRKQRRDEMRKEIIAKRDFYAREVERIRPLLKTLIPMSDEWIDVKEKFDTYWAQMVAQSEKLNMV